MAFGQNFNMKKSNVMIKQDLDEISGQLIETATFNGCFDSEFDERVESLQNQLVTSLPYAMHGRYY